MNEIWMPIKGYEDRYLISSCGNVESLVRNKRKFLKANPVGVGYPAVYLCKEGTIKRVLVHRLVAEHFIPNPNKKPEVNHINGNKADNRLENLEWCTRLENARHAAESGLYKTGELHGGSVLTEVKVREIRESYVKGNRKYSTRALAKKYNVSQTLIRDIISHKKWKGVV